jgi:hypothetical protein
MRPFHEISRRAFGAVGIAFGCCRKSAPTLGLLVWEGYADPKLKGKVSRWDDLSSVYMAAQVLGYDQLDHLLCTTSPTRFGRGCGGELRWRSMRYLPLFSDFRY